MNIENCNLTGIEYNIEHAKVLLEIAAGLLAVTHVYEELAKTLTSSGANIEALIKVTLPEKEV